MLRSNKTKPHKASPKTDPRSSAKKTSKFKSSINMRTSCQEYFVSDVQMIQSHHDMKTSSALKPSQQGVKISESGVKPQTLFRQVKSHRKKLSAGKQTTRESASEISSPSRIMRSLPRSLKGSKSTARGKNKLHLAYMSGSEYLQQKPLQELYERTCTMLDSYQLKIMHLEQSNRKLQSENTRLKKKAKIY